MKILHLTDFHFKKLLHNEFKQDTIVENIINHHCCPIKTIKKEAKLMAS